MVVIKKTCLIGTHAQRLQAAYNDFYRICSNSEEEGECETSTKSLSCAIKEETSLPRKLLSRSFSASRKHKNWVLNKLCWMHWIVHKRIEKELGSMPHPRGNTMDQLV